MSFEFVRSAESQLGSVLCTPGAWQHIEAGSINCCQSGLTKSLWGDLQILVRIEQ
jgi:hypothetical protein